MFIIVYISLYLCIFRTNTELMNFNYYLSSYLKKNGTQLIRLKIETSKKDVQYIDSGISVLKNQWDDKKKKIKRHPLEEKLNANLQSLLISVQQIYYNNKGISAKRLLLLYKNNKKYDTSSFLDFYWIGRSMYTTCGG